MRHARTMHGCASYHGRCIVAGGWDIQMQTSDSVEWHHPVLNQWTELGHLWTPRHLLSLVTLDSQLYAVGGFDHHSQILNYVERYDAPDNCWVSDSTLNVARGGMSVCALGGKMVGAAGWRMGEDKPGIEPCDVTETFDPVTKKWTLASPLHQARAQASCCEYEGEMWVVGGWDEDKRMTSTVESYNIASDTWTMRPSLPVELVACALAVMPTSKGVSLCTLGGFYHEDEKFKYVTDSCFRLDRELGKWVYEEALTLPYPCTGHQMITV